MQVYKNRCSMQHMLTKAKGFTLVEVLVIAPVIILFIGIFVAMLVGLTGESLTVREKNVAVYDAQAAQTDIEAAVERATEFATTTGTLPMPLGKRNETTNTPTTTAFTNTPSGNFTTLILKSPTTDKSPADPTRTLIYTGTGSCNSANALYTYMTIFFYRTGQRYV